MKKKVFSILVSVLLVFSSSGAALAAETAENRDLRGLLEYFFAKYFVQEEGDQPENPADGESAEETEKVVLLVNQERAKAGLSLLESDSSLNRLAQLKAEDMAENRYFSHTSPTYGSAFDMMQDAGISYRTAGENIARGQKTAEAVMKGWMNSSGHRENILGSGYTRIGTGCAAGSGDTLYWVQIFAG